MSEFRLFPEFSLDDFHELVDNKALFYWLVGSAIWFCIGFLLNFNIYTAYGSLNGLLSVLLFGVMILFSMVLLVFAKMFLDPPEPVHWFNSTYIMFGFVLVIVSYIFLSEVARSLGLNIVSLWNTEMVELPSTPLATAPIYFHFFFLSRTLGISSSTLFNAINSIFLVSPAEELTFRGLGNYGAGKLVGSPWVGALVMTGVWASIHAISSYTGPEAWLSVIMAYVGGFWMLYMMLMGQSIVVSMAIHAVYNVFVIVSTATQQPALNLGATVGMMAFGFVYLRAKNKWTKSRRV